MVVEEVLCVLLIFCVWKGWLRCDGIFNVWTRIVDNCGCIVYGMNYVRGTLLDDDHCTSTVRAGVVMSVLGVFERFD